MNAVDDDIAEGGIAWLKQTHLLSGRRDAPSIVMCANGDKDARRAAYEYGCYNAIEKPIDPASYLCIARNALSMQVMRRNDANNVTTIVEQMKVVQAQIEDREVPTIYGLLHAVNSSIPSSAPDGQSSRDRLEDRVPREWHSERRRAPVRHRGARVPLSEAQALAYIDRQSGTTFDPEVVEGLRIVVESPLGEPVPGKR